MLECVYFETATTTKKLKRKLVTTVISYTQPLGKETLRGILLIDA